MYVECVKRFRDKETGNMREVEDVFEVTRERMKRINGTRYGVLVKETRIGKGSTEK